MITWFTQPVHSFASYYIYFPVYRILIRIRLELGRSGGSGHTKAMLNTNTLVGFGAEGETDPSQLQDNPANDLFEYDWENNHWGDRHEGNKVTDNPNLPHGITELHLKLVALALLQSGQNNLVLTNSNASEDQLAAAINNVATPVLNGILATLAESSIKQTVDVR